jgi:hypothetical protein
LTVTRRSDGTLSVVNGLGITIRNLWLADEKGAVYNLTGLAAGASATLTTTREHVGNGSVGQLRTAFQRDWVHAVQRGGRFSDLLRSGTYVVELDTCPFLEEGLRSASQKKSEAIVYGIMKGPGDED